VSFFPLICFFNFLSLVVVSMIILFVVKRKERRPQGTGYNQETEDRLRALLEELSELSTALYKDVADKEAAMRFLLGQAQEKIEVLTALKEGKFEVRRVSLSDNPLEKDVKKAPASLPSTSDARMPDSNHEPLKKKAPYSRQKLVPLETSQDVLEYTQEVLEKKQSTIHERVYTLADEGLSILDIARIVNKQKGEIELILNLRKMPVKQL
jgi:hypothetical protein